MKERPAGRIFKGRGRARRHRPPDLLDARFRRSLGHRSCCFGEDHEFPRAVAFAASAIRGSAVVVVTCDKEFITGGHADGSVKLISPDGAKTVETASGHVAPVTCLALLSQLTVVGCNQNEELDNKLKEQEHHVSLIEKKH